MYEDLEFDILDLKEVSGEKKLDVFNMYGIEAKPSDLATINSGSKEGYYLKTPCVGEFGGNYNGYYLSFVRDNSVFDNYFYGDEGLKVQYDPVKMNIRPVIRDKELFKLAYVNKKIDIDGEEVFEFGEFPQKLVNKETQDKLEKELSNDYNYDIKKNRNIVTDLLHNKTTKLKKTGKKYTLPQITSRGVNGYNFVQYDEYEYEGRKYIRYHTSNSFNYSNLKINDIDIWGYQSYWIEVKPIKWYLDYKTQTLVAKNSLISCVKKDFNYKATIIDENYYGKYEVIGIEIVDYLKNYFSKDIEPSTIRETFASKFKKNKDGIDSDLEDKMINELENEQKKKELTASIIKTIATLQEQAIELSKITNSVDMNQFYHLIKVPNEIILKKVEDHFEINEIFLPVLKFIDLSNLIVYEKYIKVSGIDFTDTNIVVNPQRAYNKDLSNSIFGDKNIYGLFDGVDIRGTDLSKVSKPLILDGAITDENTKLPYEGKINRL